MQFYLHLSYQAWFAKVNIIFRIKIFQRIYKCWHVDIIVIIKMAKPPGRKRKKNTTITLSAMSFILTTNWLFRDILTENMIEILIYIYYIIKLAQFNSTWKSAELVSYISWEIKIQPIVLVCENSWKFIIHCSRWLLFLDYGMSNFPVTQKTTTKCFNHVTSRSSQL